LEGGSSSIFIVGDSIFTRGDGIASFRFDVGGILKGRIARSSCQGWFGAWEWVLCQYDFVERKNRRREREKAKK
jgi:hypothetical protein